MELVNHPLGPCPDWCVRHEADNDEYRDHVSAPYWWQTEMSQQVEFEMVRHDMAQASEWGSVGQIDFNVRIALPDEPIEDGEESFMTVDWVRSLIEFMSKMVELADPFNTNGEPLEWHQAPTRSPESHGEEIKSCT